MRTEWKQLAPVKQRAGHQRVTLCAGGKKINVFVHKIVLETFVGPCPDGMEGCHSPDRDPSNNRLENLRWDTHAENIEDKTRHGTTAKGEGHGEAVLTEKQVIEIRSLFASGAYSQKSLAAMFGVVKGTIFYIVRGITWRHVL